MKEVKKFNEIVDIKNSTSRFKVIDVIPSDTSEEDRKDMLRKLYNILTIDKEFMI